MLRQYLRKVVDLVVQFTFARRNFKLLLRSSLSDIDSRVQAVVAATSALSNAVRPIVIRAPFGKSTLVIAPHQDDEVIGCGGAMALQRRSGGSVRVVVLHDGAAEHGAVSLTREELSEKRNEESRAAARVIGVEEPIFLGERRLGERMQSVAGTLRGIIEAQRVDTLFTPFVLDGHPDHQACNRILARALEDVARPIRVLQYEVWASCIPNVAVVIDEVIEEKRRMLACFEFANSATDYAHATVGLNMFHSRLLPAGKARYVEAFFETPREEYLEMVKSVLAREGRVLGAGTPAVTSGGRIR